MSFRDGEKIGRWWRESEESVADMVVATAKALREKDSARRSRMAKSLSVYSGKPIGNLGSSLLNLESETSGEIVSGSGDNPTFNGVKSMVDAVTAKLAKNKPSPSVVTIGGDWQAQQRAETLEAFVAGLIYRAGLYATGPLVFRDSAVVGVGLVKVTSSVDHREEQDDVGRIDAERVLPWEVFVDPRDARYGDPRCLFQRKAVDREILAESYPKLASEINAAPQARDDGEIVDADTLADQVEVFEAWRLPSSNYSGDGRHVIAIEGASIVDEMWDVPRFPFAWITWSPGFTGIWGRSLVEGAEGIQIELNELLQKIAMGHYYHAVPRLAVQKGSVVPDSITNDIEGAVIEYTAGMQPPTLLTQNIFGADLYGHLDRLMGWLFQSEGVSQLSASSMKPAGLDSGKALMVHNDIESERFVLRGMDYEQLFVSIGGLMLDEARRLDARGLAVEVVGRPTSARGKALHRLKWADVKIDEEAFELQVMPVSSLPKEPAGKLQTIQQLVNSGLIQDRSLALHLLGFPDLDQGMDDELASYDLARQQIDRMLNHGEPLAPEPMMDLTTTVRVVAQAYSRALLNGAPDERVELLRQYLDAAAAMQADAVAAQAPPSPEQAMPQ